MSNLKIFSIVCQPRKRHCVFVSIERQILIVTMPKKKKKTKKSTPKPIHYVQLRTHRQYSDASHYTSHLEVYNSKTQPLIYDIDRILNQKWIHIRRSEKNIQLNEIHQQEIRKEFLHKVIQRKFFFTLSCSCVSS